jgi:RNA polymerase sigma-70 factor (ECF subfamily)
MMSVCRRYAGNKEEAEDFLQEGFIRVFDKLNTYSGNGSLEGWIRRVIVHTALNKLRSRKVYSDIPDEAPYTDESIPDAISDMSERDLLSMIAALPEGYRTVFNMFAIDGYDHAEIASTLGISEGTSRSQLAKARMALKAQLINKKKVDEHAYPA